MITSVVLGGLVGYLAWATRLKLTGFIADFLPDEFKLGKDEQLLLGFALFLLALGFAGFIFGLHFRLFWVALGAIFGYLGPKIWDYFRPVL